jgi:hypothetical protein
LLLLLLLFYTTTTTRAALMDGPFVIGVEKTPASFLASRNLCSGIVVNQNISQADSYPTLIVALLFDPIHFGKCV